MLQSIVNSVQSNSFNDAIYSMHLLDKVNYRRVAYRIRQTVDDPQTPMKVVLFEYNYTKLSDVNKGVVAGDLETIPGTTVHIQYVVHTEVFKDLMRRMFCVRPEFTWFHRNKWERDGHVNLTRRQVVLVYTPPVVQVQMPSPTLTAITNENEYAGMPALIPLNRGPLPPTPLNLTSLNQTFYPNNWGDVPVTPNLIGVTHYT
jgi:hypothetical protein